MFHKRGQVTIFIILGILLLIAIALVILFRQEITIFKPERVIPTEVAPIVTFGDHCLEQISVDALNLLGAQGGYIYFPDEIANNPLSYLDTGLKIPYWQYNTQNRIPSLPLMQAHLNRYIEEHFNDCLQDFQPFQTEYDIVIKGSPDAETEINEGSVFFQVNYPLEVRDKEGTKISDIDEFQFVSPVKLKRVHDVAKKIMETEAAEARLEKITIDLLSLDPAIPISGMDLSCQQKTWRVSEIETKLKSLLTTNLPSVRIEKTSFLPVPEDQPYVENHYLWKVTELNYPDIQATVQFSESHPLLLQVSPRSGDLLKSGQQKGADVASFICIQMWKFTYSLQFPVMVTVEDEDNNYALNFAFDIQIDKNRASRTLLGTAPQFFVQYDASEEAFCAGENIFGQNYMKIYTYDNITDPLYGQLTPEPINKVNITFTCLKYTCLMGQTGFQQGGAVSLLEARFPYCANGIVRGKKTGYKTAEQFVTAAPGKRVDLYLTPTKTFTQYSVIKHTDQGTRSLAADESVFITLKYVKNNITEHTASVSYPAAPDAQLLPLELLAGADFTYNLEILLMDEEKLLGGYQGTWTPAWSKLETAQEIEFPVQVAASTSDEAMVNFMANLPAVSTQLPPPTLK